MKNILAASVFFLSALSCAQSKQVRVYAYQQPVLPGARMITIDESGNTKETPNKTSTNNFVFIEVPPGKKVEPIHLWIDGTLYDIKKVKPELPVVNYNPTVRPNKPDTLVRNTTNQVMQLDLMPPATPFNPSASAKRKIKSNQVVVHTMEDGKNCYYYLEHAKILDPVALQ